MKTAIIIGGGPAGCQCALWLHMLGYQAVIVEISNQLGGLQNNSPYENNWLVGTMNLQGKNIAKNIQTHIEMMKIPVYYNSTIESIEKITDGFEVTIGDITLSTYAIVIATCVKPSTGQFHATTNTLIGPGKQIQEYPFTKRRVAILGGGDNAAENYAFIKDKNPEHCHVYARTVRARYSLWNKIDSADTFVGEYSADQESMTITHNGKTQTYDNFVVLYGWEANIPNALSSLNDILLDKKNFIYTDDHRRTKISTLFAAGEVTQRTHPCVATAMADGTIVAKSIQRQFENMELSKQLRSKL